MKKTSIITTGASVAILGIVVYYLVPTQPEGKGFTPTNSVIQHKAHDSELGEIKFPQTQSLTRNDGAKLNSPQFNRELSDLRQRLKKLNQVVSEQSSELASLRTKIDNMEDPEMDGEKDYSGITKSEEKAMQRIALLEENVRSEPVDNNWTPQAEDAIHRALSDAELGGTAIINVDCRSTLCRMEIAHDNSQALLAFQDTFFSQVSGLLPGVLMDHIERENGTTETVVYLARESYALPSLEEEQ
ncbi:MAG: hypothetical protein V3V31_12810 [Methylococcales bacterium]